ncbi:response regulator [Emticicia sp. CRIBPO]|uniref:PAS domain-containing hybrid sensor histidine kinase/response regulator n=1 Tax=Emticicia sp. CRIBPO TaxID=2683258 RepID=UPI00141249F8|nr:ATP-binding protein [Emticicia sp. CRIBPO]NBA84800.1 response regulator [Emticicia sp. CRIBPO]
MTSLHSEDITETKLKALTAHLHALITSIEDIVFEVDGNMVFRNVWVHDESMLFMPKEQFIGKTIEEVMGPLAPSFMEPIRDVIKTGEPREAVYKHIDPSTNQWFKVKIKQVFKASELSDLTMVVTIQDITYQVLSDLLLQETKKKLELNRQLLEVSQSLSRTAGWEFNLTTGEIFWTKQAYIMFEQNENFIPTFESIRAFIHEEDRERIAAITHEAVTTETGFDTELRIITPSGKMIWIRSMGSPVFTDGEAVSIRGAFMDITQHKENELELTNARIEAERASKAKSDFLSIMSHEIRTPLNGIIGIANLLKLNHSEDQKEYISNLIFSGDHLMQLINDILDLTKMENDKLELAYSELDLRQLVKNIKNQFQNLAETKKIQLNETIDDRLPGAVFADSVRLGQILNNLISNAIKFTDEGEVRMSITLVSNKKGQAKIRFSVKDSGIGISKEAQESVFESFKQVQHSTQRKHFGTGLGLAITKRLVELHDSEIFLNSEPGVGSEFYFEVSFRTSENQEIRTEQRTSMALPDYGRKLSGLKVLLVEDNLINVIVAKKQLEYFGVQPDSVNSGKDAVAILKENTYHVALVDLHMPEMDGYELATIIRKEYPEIHIIVFTADIMAEVKAKLAEMGIYDIINKPFVPQKMYEMLSGIAVRKGVV